MDWESVLANPRLAVEFVLSNPHLAVEFVLSKPHPAEVGVHFVR